MSEIVTAIGMDVCYYDSVPAQGAETVKRLDLDELLSTSDIISLHLPNSPASRHLISRERSKMMKPGAMLINTARGELVDEVALFEALQSGICLRRAWTSRRSLCRAMRAF